MWLLTPVFFCISVCSTSQSTPNGHSQDASWWQQLPRLRPNPWSPNKHLRSCSAALPTHSPDLFSKRLGSLASLHASSPNVHTVFDAVANPSEPSDNCSSVFSTHSKLLQDSEANSRSTTSQKKREADSLHQLSEHHGGRIPRLLSTAEAIHVLSPPPASSRHTSHQSHHGEMKLPPLARRRANLQHRACSRHPVLDVLLSPSMMKERSSPGMSTQHMKNLQEVFWWQQWFR